MSDSISQDKQAGLYMVNTVANLPNYLMPMAKWDDVLYFGDIQLANRHGNTESTDWTDTTAPLMIDLLWVGYV